jgi:hypothetical protein
VVALLAAHLLVARPLVLLVVVLWEVVLVLVTSILDPIQLLLSQILRHNIIQSYKNVSDLLLVVVLLVVVLSEVLPLSLKLIAYNDLARMDGSAGNVT